MARTPKFADWHKTDKANREADQALISEIAERAVTYAWTSRKLRLNKIDFVLDLVSAHGNTPLRLVDLLTADDFNFVHDVFGIHRHLDHATGELTDGFVPRFAKRQSEAA